MSSGVSGVGPGEAAEGIGRPAQFMSSGAGRMADTSSFTSLRRSPDALGTSQQRGMRTDSRPARPRRQGQGALRRVAVWSEV